MADVQVGDKVFDELGALTDIISKSELMYRPCYKITFSDKSTLVADYEHLWTVLDARCRTTINRELGFVPDNWPTWKSKGRPLSGRYSVNNKSRCEFPSCELQKLAGGLCQGHYLQLRKGKLLTPIVAKSGRSATTLTSKELKATYLLRRDDSNYAIPAAKPLQFADVQLPIDPYTLGCWLGDGHKHGALITSADLEILEEISAKHKITGLQHYGGAKAMVCTITNYRDPKVCRRGHPKSHYWSGGHCRLCENSNRKRRVKGLKPSPWKEVTLHANLRKLNLICNKHIPRIYFEASYNQRLALLQGLMDTDGCVSRKETVNVCNFGNTNKRLIDDFIELATGLGIIVRKQCKAAKLYGRFISDAWKVELSPPMQVFRLKRKAERLKFDGSRFTKRQQRFIVKVESIGICPVQCIGVASANGLYLAGKSLIPTHNSKTAAALALLRAFLYPRSLILLLSPTLRQSGELFRDKIRTLYNDLGRPIASTSESALGMELVNGSRIVCLPGNEKTIQGYSNVALLIVDEGSRIPENLYLSVRPFLAVSQGQLICLSTPFGKRGWFYQAWYGMENDERKVVGEARECLSIKDEWTRFYADATDCPRITKEFLEEERKALGERWYLQEYFCSFADMIGAVFSSDDLAIAMELGDSIEPLDL